MHLAYRNTVLLCPLLQLVVDLYALRDDRAFNGGVFKHGIDLVRDIDEERRNGLIVLCINADQNRVGLLGKIAVNAHRSGESRKRGFHIHALKRQSRKYCLRILVYCQAFQDLIFVVYPELNARVYIKINECLCVDRCHRFVPVRNKQAYQKTGNKNYKADSTHCRSFNYRIAVVSPCGRFYKLRARRQSRKLCFLFTRSEYSRTKIRCF